MPGDTAQQPKLEQSARVPTTPILDSPASFNNGATSASHRVLDIGQYPPSETIGGKPAKQVLSPCHKSEGFVWRTLYTLGRGVVFLFIIMPALASFGLPYWYHRFYRFQSSLHRGGQPFKTEQQLIREQWLLVVKHLRSQWKASFTLSTGVLPVVLPMLTAYPIPKCSWPFLLSAIALLSALTTLMITSLYQCHSDSFRHEGASNAWNEASRSFWDTSAKGFWVLISLPTIWLLYFICSLVASIILVVWDQASTEQLVSDLCLSSRVYIFRTVLLTLLCTALMHLIFIVSVLLFRSEGWP